jgi:transposase
MVRPFFPAARNGRPRKAAAPRKSKAAINRTHSKELREFAQIWKRNFGIDLCS